MIVNRRRSKQFATTIQPLEVRFFFFVFNSKQTVWEQQLKASLKNCCRKYLIGKRTQSRLRFSYLAEQRREIAKIPILSVFYCCYCSLVLLLLTIRNKTHWICCFVCACAECSVAIVCALYLRPHLFVLKKRWFLCMVHIDVRIYNLSHRQHIVNVEHCYGSQDFTIIW